MSVVVVAGIDYLVNNFILYVILSVLALICYSVYLGLDYWRDRWKDKRKATRKQRATDNEHRDP